MFIHNKSFELADVKDGQFQQGVPDFWQSTDPNKVYLYDPNDSDSSQWDTFYDSGETIPEGEQVVRLAGGTIQQDLGEIGILGYTTYLLEVDTGAYIDPNTSEAIVKLLACDPNYPDRLEELIVIDVSESSEPNGFGVQLDEGKWVTQGGYWSSSEYPEYNGWFMRLTVDGNYVDIDQVILSASTFLGTETEPLLVSQMAEPNSPSEPNILFVTWDYDSDAYTAIERRWVDNVDDQTARIIKYYYEDDTFNEIVAKTEYEELNDNPDDPNGFYYTTYYTSTVDDSGIETILINETLYPSGKRKDVQILESGLVIESYTEDVETGNKVNDQSYTYYPNSSNIKTHTDARGGLTEYSYTATYPDDLLYSQKEPETAAGERVTQYGYDGARRMIYESHQDSEGTWIRTSYNYNSENGFLDSVVVDDDIKVDDVVIYEGKKLTTSYVYNDFGQVTREISPDDVVTGKSYGLGGELNSDFIITSGCDPNQSDPDLILVSQTCYYYDTDGRIEYIKKVSSDSTFQYNDPDDPNDSLEWVVTQYQYDFLGRKTAVIEDVDGLALKTEYEYNNQGEVAKVTLPNGKWTQTYRDGRGLTVMQVTGHDQLPESKWQVSQFKYDANGNLEEQVSPDGISTLYEYDNFDRLVKVKRGITD